MASRASEPPRFDGKSVRLTFADAVGDHGRRLISELVRGLVRRIEDGPAGEDALVLAIPLAAANCHLVARLAVRTSEVIEFAVSQP